MTRPSCVPSSALLPRRGLPLSGDPGDLHLGVALAVAHPSPVAGLVLVMNDVDLGAGYRAQDLRGDLVVAKLVGVADDLAIIDHEHGRKRHTGPDLTSEGVDGQDVVYRRLLLPATAAHDRVHRRTLSLLVRARHADPRLRIEDTKGGSPALHWAPWQPSLGIVLCAGSSGYQTPAGADASDAVCPAGSAAASGGPGSRVAARRRRRPPNGWAVPLSACSPPPAPLPAASAASGWLAAAGWLAVAGWLAAALSGAAELSAVVLSPVATGPELAAAAGLSSVG